MRQDEFNKETLRISRIAVKIALVSAALTLIGTAWMVFNDLGGVPWAKGMLADSNASEPMDSATSDASSGPEDKRASSESAENDASEEGSPQIEVAATLPDVDEIQADDKPNLDATRLWAWVSEGDLTFWGALGHTSLILVAFAIVASGTAFAFALCRIMHDQNNQWFGIPYLLVLPVGGVVMGVYSFGGEQSAWWIVPLVLVILIESVVLLIASFTLVLGTCEKLIPYRDVADEIKVVARKFDTGRGPLFRWFVGESLPASASEVQAKLVETDPSVVEQAIMEIDRIQGSLPGVANVRRKFPKERATMLHARLSRIRNALHWSREERSKRDAAKAVSAAKAQEVMDAAAKVLAEAEAALAKHKARREAETQAKEKERTIADAIARDQAWQGLDVKTRTDVKRQVESLVLGQEVRFAVEGQPNYHHFVGRDEGNLFFSQLDGFGRPTEESIWCASEADVLNAYVLDSFRPLESIHENVARLPQGIYFPGTVLNRRLIKIAIARPRPVILG
ncbi:hypothetical protein [Glycomyces sp. NPDC048151]|uniref:hypothetical protein n=1 Tax=Glycomyces sp. NPDC048151 TaxID=3364002 RepID=UPI0037104C04